MAVNANSGRKNQADIYRPVGPKAVALSQAWSSGGQLQFNQQVDLSLPVRGFRFVLKGRCVVGTAGMATITPEGFLNLISNIVIQGTNARQKGNVTLWQIDLATAHGIQHLVNGSRAAFYAINANAGAGLVQVSKPGTPWPADNNPTNATGTFDFVVAVDLPLHPFAAQAFGAHPHWVPAYLMRNEEWKDSVQIQVQFPAVANGAVAGPLGTGAAGTTLVFSSFGSGAGTPTVDIYSLPIIMGMDLKDAVLPGVLSRTTVSINTILQAAGNNVTLNNMQKQPTTRVFLKTGVGTVPPAFSALSDTNVTAAGIVLGANRNVRNVVDVFAHKSGQFDTYQRELIQGYLLLDFMESGNPDSAYPGQDIGDGASFQLNANVAGVANAQGIIVQEQTLHTPTGPLYTF
jgi:hypothetical protein